MARLNDDAQWIIMIGFVISISILFLALIIDESTVVGQTTAEGVLEFPKHEIRDLNEEIITTINGGVIAGHDYSGIADDINNNLDEDITTLALVQKSTVIQIDPAPAANHLDVGIHYNNGVTSYDETIRY